MRYVSIICAFLLQAERREEVAAVSDKVRATLAEFEKAGMERPTLITGAGTGMFCHIYVLQFRLFQSFRFTALKARERVAMAWSP